MPPTCSVIASAAKQSRVAPRRQSGLLRSARNDGPSGIRRSHNVGRNLQTHLRIPAACSARALLHLITLFRLRAQGRPGAGWHPRSTVRGLRYKRLHSGIQVKPNNRPSLRSGWNGLCRALPGERCTIAPVALRMADAADPVGPPHHRNTWRTDPGRQDHTILPYAGCTGRVRDAFAHGFPPCKAVRADAACVHHVPSRVS